MIGLDLRVTAWNGWRGLAIFWAVILGSLMVLAGVLQMLGPPERPRSAKPGSAPTAQLPEKPAQAVRSSSPAQPYAPLIAGDVDAELSERAPAGIDGYLPRVGSDGRRPMQAYAARFDSESRSPRVGLLLAGIGMNEEDSLAAMTSLPSGVTLAVSPYAKNVAAITATARQAGHEVLISIPMEPTEFPISDPGPSALMTTLTPDTNLERLHWAMARASSYVGLTNALGPMRGERFSGMTDQMSMVQRELGRRGLLFVDARIDAGENAFSWGRRVDIVIDELPAEIPIDQRLELLARLARDRGMALGLATAPRPVTLNRIVAWVNSLPNRQIVLAPVSAIVVPPSSKDTIK